MAQTLGRIVDTIRPVLRQYFAGDPTNGPGAGRSRDPAVRRHPHGRRPGQSAGGRRAHRPRYAAHLIDLGIPSTDERRSERTVHPYGIVAHPGRWYVIGADSGTGSTRIFRLDRIATPRVLDGTFDTPDGFNAADEVLSGLAQAPPSSSESSQSRRTRPATTSSTSSLTAAIR
jgi:WYL domain